MRKDRKKSSSGSSSKLNEDDDPFFNDDDDFDDDFDDNDGILGMEFGLLSAKNPKRKSKHFSTPDAVQTKTIASLNRSGGQTAAINAKIKGAMRVLVPLFNQSKNMYDETSTIQALETIQTVSEEPKGSLILSNMKLLEKLKVVIANESLSSNIHGAAYKILATMVSCLAKLETVQMH